MLSLFHNFSQAMLKNNVTKDLTGCNKLPLQLVFVHLVFHLEMSISVELCFAFVENFPCDVAAHTET